MKATDSYRFINQSPLKGIILYYSNLLLSNIKPVKLRTVISEIQTGKTPPKSQTKYYQSQDIDWFKPSDIGHSKYLEEAKEKFSAIALKEKKATLYPKNTLLMIGIGGGVGRVSLLRNEGSSNQQITGILFNEDIFPEWAYYYYLVREDYVKSQAKSMSFPILNQGKIRNLEFKYPNIEEQIEVCKFLDHCWQSFLNKETPNIEEFDIPGELKSYSLKQFKAIQLDSSLKTIIQTQKSLFTHLKQAILQEAIQGKLTHEWRAQNPELITGENSATTLLKNIKVEKARLVKEKKIKKEIPLPPIEKEEIPFELPEGWVWCRLGEICNNVTAGSTPSKDSFNSGQIPYLKVYNIRNQKVDFDYKPQFIKKEVHLTSLKRCILKPGDVIMNIVGPPLGKVAIIPSNFPEWNCNQAISIFRGINEEVNPFIYQYLCAGLYLNYLHYKGMAGQDNISVTMCKELIMGLPPLEEQKAIVGKVEALMEKCTVLEQEITQSEQSAQMLMQAVLKEVFEGNKLTLKKEPIINYL